MENGKFRMSQGVRLATPNAAGARYRCNGGPPARRASTSLIRTESCQ